MNLSPTRGIGYSFTICIMLQRLHFTPCLIREIRLVGSLYDNAVSFPYDIRQSPFVTGITGSDGLHANDAFISTDPKVSRLRRFSG